MTGLEGLLAGRVLGGRYLIEEVIGRGGMGAVYRALDERLGRRVAVKVITMAGASDPESRERLRARFHREARAAAALPHHPNVVPVYDYGTDEALGLDFLVMELLRGTDLASRIARSGPPPLPAGLRILAQAARGLSVGHRAGLVHRDVKPGNIFLAEADHGEIQVRVVDFGIAKLVDEEDTSNQLTQDGRVPHSPAFASPEQLRGLSRLSTASDVFSLGAVGFLLLTGERPYSDADRNRMSLGMPVPPPPARTRNPAIPATVEEILQKALAYDPEERFRDASAMLGVLDQVLRELPDTPLEPYSAGPILPGPADAAPARTPAPVADDEDRTQFMGGDDDDRTLLAPPLPPATERPAPPAPETLPPLPERHPEPPRRRRRTGLWVWMLTLLALAAVVVWVVSQSGGGSQQPVAVAPAEPDTAQPPADTVAPVDSAQLARQQNQEGLALYRSGRFDRAAELFRGAVAAAPDNAEYRRNLGLALLEMGDAGTALAQFLEARNLAPARTVVLANMAQAQLALGDTTAAIRSLETFIDRTPEGRQRLFGERLLRDIQETRLDLLGQPADTLPADPSAVQP